MCGIVGLHSNSKVETQFIINACAKMNKRGPDNSEILSLSNNICFAIFTSLKRNNYAKGWLFVRN